jgi:hypothetical protein
VELAGSRDKVRWLPQWKYGTLSGPMAEIAIFGGAHLGPEAELDRGRSGPCSAPAEWGGNAGGGRGVRGAYGEGTTGWRQRRVETAAVWVMM